MKFVIVLVILIGGFMQEVQAYQEKRVEFNSHGETLVGTLYVPKGDKKKYPVVVVTGAWTTVKEQMPRTYALELVKQGYAVLVFDFTGWGESTGENRFVEDPQTKTQDIIEAINFLVKRSEIDATKIVGLGICASSGYMAAAYTQSTNLKSVALVAPWLHDKEIATQVYGGEKSVKTLIKMSEKAELDFRIDGKLTTVLAASTTDQNAIMYQVPYYTETNRGLIPEYDNKFNLSSWKHWLTYNAMEFANNLPDKILLVVSKDMALPQGAQKYSQIAGDKVLQVNIGSYNQFEFYDQESAVTKATKEVVDFFAKQLQ